MIATLTALWLVGAALAADGETSVAAGYLGEFATHPGVFAAVARPVAEGPALSLHLGGRAGVYHHFRHHTGLVVTGEFTGRATARGGLFGDVAIGLGVRHRVLAGAVYRPDADGVRRGVDVGRPGLLVTAAIGAGHVIRAKSDRPLRLFGRLEGWGVYPINHRLVPTVALAIGVGWSP